MAITIKNGAKVLYQWERGVALTVTAPCDVLRVSREEEQRSVDLFPTWSGNTGTVLIPDRMLTESGYLRAARIDKGEGGERVMERARIIIRAAQKPGNGASSKREIRDWEELRIRMAALERAAREGKFDGEDGTTPHIGENGNWYIGDTDTGVNAKGDDGLTPHIGENGNWYIGDTDTGVKVTGEDGITPHIGENGNWYIGGVDTGVKATGDNGITPHIGENGNWYIGEEDTGVKARSENVSEYAQDLVTNGVYVADDPDAMLCKPVGGTEANNPIRFRAEPGVLYVNGVRKKVGAAAINMKSPETERIRAFGYRLYEETDVIKQIVWDVEITTDVDGNEIITAIGYDPDFISAVLPVREGGIYDILIYTVTVPAGATQATQDMIRDLRGDERYCGFVRSKLAEDGGGASVDIDDTLAVPGAAADAAAVGAALKNKYGAENEPPYPVKSVCGKTGAVSLTAGDVGADPSGRAKGLLEAHNISGAAHNDIRLLISGLTTRLNALADSDDTTLDQLSEIVEYIKANKTLIDSITTSKVSVADIIDNLTTSVSNKPLSAKMGVELKKLIDAIEIPTSLPASDVPDWAKQPSKPTYTKSEVELGNVDNVRQYSASNPPPYPVTSVNGQTGVVSVTAEGLGAASKETVEQLSETIAALETKGVQQTPLFASSIEECTDTSKLYVLPDGYIYAYMEYTEETIVPGETVTTPGEVTFIPKTRYSLSSAAFKSDDTYDMLIIPVVSDGVSDSIEIILTGMTYSNYWSSYCGDANNRFTTETAINNTSSSELFCTNIAAGKKYMTLCVVATDTSNLGVIVDGEAFRVVVGTTDSIGAKHSSTTTTEGTTEIVKKEGFVSTGHAFVPADYEDRIIELEKQVGTVDENTVVHNAIGATYPPSQKPAETDIDGYDIDILNSLADDVYGYIDAVVSDKETVTKEVMGKDESGAYDIVRYIYANREHIAWRKQDYPKMYAWQNDSTVIYSESVSPRIGDTMYSTAYIGTAYSTVTAVSATNRSRTVNSLEFVRYESGDIEPTIIYTDSDDDRNSNTSITQNGVTYIRYPLGDLGANRTKLIPIFIYANEHGIYPAALDESNASYQKYETKMCALVAARMLRDFADDKQMKNPLFKYIRENCMLIVIPVVNPYGFNLNVTVPDTSLNGYTNSNRCNINRNYDCPGWDVMLANGESAAWMGEYAGSENETQYVMNTMVESGAAVAMSLHGLGGWAGYCAHQGQSPDGSDYNRDKLELVNNFLYANYGYILRYYDLIDDGTPAVAVNTPDITSKSPSYITQCGAYGGIVEFQPDDVNTSGFLQEMKSNVIENAYAQTLNLTAMWLSDYLES